MVYQNAYMKINRAMKGENIMKLKELWDIDGIITQEEFEAKKKELLDSI